MKITMETILIAAAVYFLAIKGGSQGGSSIWNPQTGTGGNTWQGFSPTNLPPEPKDKKSQDWVKWVQVVMFILGGLFPKMFEKGGIFGSHDPKAVTAAAFANMNYYLNPNANFGINLNYQSYFGKTSPFFSSSGGFGSGGFGGGYGSGYGYGLPVGLPGGF